MKKIAKCIIPLLLLLLLLPFTVCAAGAIDLNRDVSLTISYQKEEMPLVGAEFRIYLVATVDETGELTTTDTFRQFNVDIRGENDEAWKNLASTLEGYVLRDNISPTDSGKTDKIGSLTFPTGDKKLVQGLYLVLGQRHMQGGYRYDAAPFMVMLPWQDTEKNEWSYEVTVSPKHDSTKIPDEPATITRKVLKVWDDSADETVRPEEIEVQLLRDGKVYSTVTLSADNNWRYTWPGLDDSSTWTVAEKECAGYTVRVEQDGTTFVVTNTLVPNGSKVPGQTKPTASKLPQTGQLWWPVPILLLAGLLLVAIGLIRRRRIDDEA